jgi:bifunctional UDP-N-acetylglucosamine pyrophosphorylase/glucosamine-1-phosphate N-acetyltransferase
MAARTLIAVILAAGEGTRMKSDLPKVLHPVAGRSLLDWVTCAAEGAGRLSARVVVTGRGHERLAPILEPRGWRPVVQRERLGTGHALRVALKALPAGAGDVLVLNGDTPLVTPETLRRLVRKHRASGGPVTLAVASLDDPHGYGRIVRDAAGRVASVAEQKSLGRKAADCREINPGFYVFDLPFLRRELHRLKPDAGTHEYYLTELVAVAHRLGRPAAAVDLGHPSEAHGVNSRRQLAEAAAILRRRILDRLMDDGVTLVDPATTYVEAGVRVGRDTTLLPGTILEGGTVVGESCRIGPWSRIAGSILGRAVEVRDSSVVEGARIEDGAAVGPFARIRPGSLIGRDARVGNFVELKKSRLGAGAKASHLTYLGDAEVGPGANIGAGTVTCNYDGVDKHRTVIGEGAFIGSDTLLVAPVSVGPGAITGAGSVITRDVPAGALGLERSPQVNLEGWAARRRSLGKRKKA